MCAREKGKKKTAALNVLSRPVREIEQDLQNDFKQENPEAQDRELPRLLVDHFSFEKLHQVMSQNNNKVLGACGELTQFYNMLHHYKTNSTMADRKTLLALNGGAQYGHVILKTLQRQWIPPALTSPASFNLFTWLSYYRKMTSMASMADSFMCALQSAMSTMTNLIQKQTLN